MATKAGKRATQLTGKGLRVLSKRDGFRRAGLSFGSEAVTISLADISEEDEKALRNEPMLVVVDIDLPVANESQAEAK